MMQKPVILIADDESRIRRVICNHLLKCGFDVAQAQDGRQALDTFTLSPIKPSLVLLDLMMPRMDGLETLSAMRAIDPAVPIIVVTARGFLSDKSKAFLSGADDYLVKPFSLEELELRIRALLRRVAQTESRASKGGVTAGRVIRNGDLILNYEERKCT